MNHHGMPMNTKYIALIILFFFQISLGTAFGHAELPAPILARPGSASATYQITCSPYDLSGSPAAPTRYLSFKFWATKSANFLVKGTLTKDGQEVSAIDPNNGPKARSPSSPGIALNGGDGTYTLTFTKVKKKSTQSDKVLLGTMTLAAEYHCTGDTHNDTSILKVN